MIHSAVRDSKDAALSFALRTFINARLQGIGETAELSVDSANRKADLRVALRGDPHVVDLHIGNYALDKIDGQYWMTLVEARASREWMNELLQQFAVGRPFPVSSIAGLVLRLLT